uniref:BTB domain-containing protein n=1 Tax=Chrysemys picta bellii TaxID=8478 RepID=A0A8C3FRR9_CHRPI
MGPAPLRGTNSHLAPGTGADWLRGQGLSRPFLAGAPGAMWPGEGPEPAEGPGEEGNTPEPRWKLRSECHARQFFEAALELRGQGQLVDMTVMAGTQWYQAHGVVLAAVLDFAYTGAFTAMPGTAGELVAAAQALGAPRVVEICRRMGDGLEGPEGRSPDEEQWETLQGMEELFRAGVGCDLALTTEGETFRGEWGTGRGGEGAGLGQQGTAGWE